MGDFQREVERPHSHIPYGADGSCFYTENNLFSFRVAESVREMTLRAVESIPKSSGAFIMCDYGTADGGNSMPLVTDTIGKIKSYHGDNKTVQVCYEDQPVNDFKSLFKMVHGLSGAKETESYMKKYSDVFVSALGTSFYQQTLPSGTLHLGLALTAFHWLSKMPVKLPDTPMHLISKDESRLEQLKSQAKADWEQVLVCRAKELTIGGQLVVAGIHCTDDHYFNGRSEGSECNFTTVTELWQLMAAEGRITQDEFLNTNFASVYRTTEEHLAPFRDTESAPYKAGLRLVEWQLAEIPCAYREEWQQSGNKDDPVSCRRYARRYLPSMRIWMNYVFLSGLSDSRSEAEKEALVDEMFHRYEDRIAANPELYYNEGNYCNMRIEKIDSN